MDTITTTESLPATWAMIGMGLMCLVSMRMLLLRRRNRVSILLPVALVAAGLIFFEHAEQPPSAIATIEDDHNEDALEELLPGPPTIDPVIIQPAPDVQIQETEHGDILVMALTTDIMEQYIGPEGVSALQNLSEVVPEQLRQAYFMVPLPGPVGESVPNLARLAGVLAQLAGRQSGLLAAEVAHEVSDELDAEQSKNNAPEWFSDLKSNPLVVSSGFEPTDADAESELHRQVTRALLTHALTTVTGTNADVPSTFQDRSFEMTSTAIHASIQEWFNDTVNVPVNGESVQMQRQSALLSFPAQVEASAVQHVTESLQNERTWTLGAAAVSLSVVVMLAAGLVQIAGSRHRLVRFVAVPAVSLLMVPGLVLTSMLMTQIARDECAIQPSPIELTGTIIDHTMSEVAER